jgi:deazaflavin-dependent oxidoreductase (nitroreductase family)
VADALDWNGQIIAEFRTNGGKVGGQFEGAPIVLLHHRGRKSGAEYAGTIYVFASKAGAPTNPDWYLNLTSAGTATVEVGTETYLVDIDEVRGAERDRIYAAQVAVNPGFAGYAEKTAGIRTIPVLSLHRRAE